MLKSIVYSIKNKFKAKYIDYVTTLLEIVVSATIGFSIGALTLYVLGYDAGRAYSILFTSGLSDVNYLLSKATPIMLTGLAFSIPLLAGVFNIGGEGQLYMGALASLVIAYYTGNPIIAIIIGVVAGALTGLIIAVLKVYRGVNEVIVAIMLNWFLYFMVLYLITDKLFDPSIPHQSIPVPPSAYIGEISTPLGPIRGIFFIAVIFSLLIYFILYYTSIGYWLRVSGLSPGSAKYAGFDPRKGVIYSMLLGGASAGLGGSLLLLGYVHTIDTTMSTLYGLGFMGIGVGLLGRNNPIGIIFSSIFFSMLIIGGEMIELKMGAPPELADVLIGMIVISLALPYAYRMVLSYIRTRRVVRK